MCNEGRESKTGVLPPPCSLGLDDSLYVSSFYPHMGLDGKFT